MNLLFAGAMYSPAASINTTYVQISQKTARKFKKLQQGVVLKEYLQQAYMFNTAPQTLFNHNAKNLERQAL